MNPQTGEPLGIIPEEAMQGEEWTFVEEPEEVIECDGLSLKVSSIERVIELLDHNKMVLTVGFRDPSGERTDWYQFPRASRLGRKIHERLSEDERYEDIDWDEDTW